MLLSVSELAIRRTKPLQTYNSHSTASGSEVAT